MTCTCHTHKRNELRPTTADSKKAFAVLAVALPEDLWDKNQQHLAKHLSDIQEKDMFLWGPEALTLQKELIKIWNESFAELLQAISLNFSVPTDIIEEISVNEKKVKKLLAELTEKMPDFWKKAKKITKAILEIVYTNSRELMVYEEDVTEDSKITRAESIPDKWKAFMLSAMEDHLKAKFGDFPEKIIGPYLNKLIDDFLKKPDATITDRLAFSERLDVLKRLPEQYFSQLSDVATGRVWSFAGIQYATERGVTMYQIHGHMDALICKVCFVLNGKIFSVESLFEKMTRFLDDPENDDLQKEMFPFLREKDVDNREILPSEGHLVPLHPNCIKKGTEAYTVSRGWIPIENVDAQDVILTMAYTEKGFELSFTKMVGKISTASKEGVGFIPGELSVIETTKDHEIPIIISDALLSDDLEKYKNGFGKVKATNLVNTPSVKDAFPEYDLGISVIRHPWGDDPVKEIPFLQDIGKIKIVPLKYDKFQEFSCIELAEHNNILIRNPGSTELFWVGNCRCNITMLKKSYDPEAPGLKAPETVLSQLRQSPAKQRDLKIKELSARKEVEKMMVLDKTAATKFSILGDVEDKFNLTTEQKTDLAEKTVLQSSTKKPKSFTAETLKRALETKTDDYRIVTKQKAYTLKADWEVLKDSASFKTETDTIAAVLKVYKKHFSSFEKTYSTKIAENILTEEEALEKISHLATRDTVKEFSWLSYTVINID